MQHKLPPIDAAEWREEKSLFEAKTKIVQFHRVEPNVEAKGYEGKDSTQLWECFIKDEIGVTHVIQTRAQLSHAVKSVSSVTAKPRSV